MAAKAPNTAEESLGYNSRGEGQEGLLSSLSLGIRCGSRREDGPPWLGPHPTHPAALEAQRPSEMKRSCSACSLLPPPLIKRSHQRPKE